MSYVTRAMVVTALTIGAWLYLVRHAERTDVGMEGCRVSYVYDGDTVALDCGGDEEVTARVQGLDAPETKSPGCDEELAHGALATDRLRDLLSRGEVTMRRMGTDKYGRILINLRVNSEHVADRLVREGLAVAYSGGSRVDWCERLGAE